MNALTRPSHLCNSGDVQSWRQSSAAGMARQFHWNKCRSASSAQLPHHACRPRPHSFTNRVEAIVTEANSWPRASLASVEKNDPCLPVILLAHKSGQCISAIKFGSAVAATIRVGTRESPMRSIRASVGLPTQGLSHKCISVSAPTVGAVSSYRDRKADS